MFSILLSIAMLSLVVIGMAITRNCVFERQTIAGAGGVNPGTLAQYNGLIWISQGLKFLEEGDPVSWRRDLVVDIDKTDPSQDIVDGTDVRVDLATQKVVAEGGVVVGKARANSPAGTDKVRIALNE